MNKMSFRNFRVSNNTNLTTNTNNIYTGKFCLDSYTTIYNGLYLKIIWNPLYKQPQFSLNTKLNHPTIIGGFKLLNDEQNSTTIFSFNYIQNTEYYFSSFDGTLNNMDTDYNLNNNWNKTTIWINSHDSRFQHHNIELFSTGNKGYYNITIL